jgi:AAA15 family ATPase/GTPase
MKVIFKNIGLIQKADIKIDGLTVIAGKNDTGKSTIGKMLFCIIKAMIQVKKNKKIPSILDFSEQEMLTNCINHFIDLVFESHITPKGKIGLIADIFKSDIFFEDSSCIDIQGEIFENQLFFKDATLLQTPVIWDMVEFFDSINRFKQNEEIEGGSSLSFKYPYLLWDVYMKISNTPPQKNKQCEPFLHIISDLISGIFKTKDGKIVFEHQAGIYQVSNMASGIKYFGLLQKLAENTKINKNHLLIIDEPENHLHPEWQLQFASLIVDMVKNVEVKILINSHSPYMIEALKVYSDKSIREHTNFYYNEKKDKTVVVKDVTFDLGYIFEQLSEPFRTLEKIDLG